MKNWFLRLLGTFDYHTFSDFLVSLAPSYKYRLSMATLAMSSIFPVVDKLLGLDGYAAIGLVLILITELTSGLIASHVKGEQFSSFKLSRFTFKLFYQLILLFSTYVMAMSYQNKHEAVMGAAFDWLHMFLMMQIIFENIVSILENAAVIEGKDKAAWINKIKDKLTNITG